MQQRTLTITVDANPRQALRARAVAAFQADGYLGEMLNFETPSAFFGRLTERRWALVQMLMGGWRVELVRAHAAPWTRQFADKVRFQPAFLDYLAAPAAIGRLQRSGVGRGGQLVAVGGGDVGQVSGGNGEDVV